MSLKSYKPLLCSNISTELFLHWSSVSMLRTFQHRPAPYVNIISRTITPNTSPPNWESSQKKIYGTLSNDLNCCKLSAQKELYELWKPCKDSVFITDHCNRDWGMKKKKTHNIYFSLHRLFTQGHVFWVPLRLPLTALRFIGESAVLTISIDFADCRDSCTICFIRHNLSCSLSAYLWK